MFDLRVVGPAGERIMDADDLQASDFVDGTGTVGYIGVCSPGLNGLGIGVHDYVGVVAGEEVPQGLVQPANVSVALSCVADEDVRLKYAFELATAREDDDGATLIAFSDIKCRTKRTCSDALVGVQVACERFTNDGLGVMLGVSHAHVVCGGLDLPVQPNGQSDALDAEFIGTATVDGTTSRWAMETATADLTGCRFEASLIAAADLVGGLGPPCMGWPVLDIELPLSTSECQATDAVDVRYVDGASFASALVIDERGPHAPSPILGWLPACGVALDVWALEASSPEATDGGVIMRDAPHGFIDFELAVSLPDGASTRH